MAEACFLCDSLARSADIEWGHRPLFLWPSVGGVVAGAGPLTPGYVLVAPTAHVGSLSRAPADARADFTQFVTAVLDQLSGVLGSLTYWEHGGCAGDGRSSACVSHAHLHVIPGMLDLGMPEVSHKYDDIGGFLRHHRHDQSSGYLMWGRHGDRCVVGPDPGISQYFRRQVAALFGIPDQWDYAAAPNPADMRLTQERILSGDARFG